ncbi:MAG: transcriptional repressor [Bacteroidetes bacterium]|mgnify:CR=1 FL=1|jgi:Fur family peroxide stress response transcriptional regulator|nr:transcriptional repressor [Bacteroidota bacterium]
MANKTVIKILSDNNLKITPQRTAVLEVLMGLDNHPSAENIAEYLRMNFPHIPLATVYKILDVFVDKGIIKKVQTDNNQMRYDFVTENHHHLYCPEKELIEDYYDKELEELISSHLAKKTIPNFRIKDIQLQIIGEFINENK